MPLDRGTIEQQLRALGEGARWWDVRELRDLPAVLNADEQILGIARGGIARAGRVRRRWLIVATRQRLLMIRSSRSGSWRQFEVPASLITRVSLRVGPFHGRVIAHAGPQTIRMLVTRPDAYRLQSALATSSIPRTVPDTGFGPMRMVHRVLEHMLALPAAAFAPDGSQRTLPAPAEPSAMDERVQTLEQEIERLREHVDFLENLLRQRHIAPASQAADV